jgi:hypothetical protein
MMLDEHMMGQDQKIARGIVGLIDAVLLLSSPEPAKSKFGR